MRFLVVDDSPEIVAVMVAMISRLGCMGVRVDHTTDPYKALALAQSGAYDLVLADYRMPGPSGLDVLRAARRANGSCVGLLMTGLVELELSDEQREEAGVTQILWKPLRSETLSEEFAKLLVRKDAIAPRA